MISRRHLFILLFAGLALPAVASESVAPAIPAPIEVRDGVFMRNGKPYRGVGVNYFDGFLRLLEDPAKQKAEPPEYVAGLAFLQKRHIPFIRFAACGFYPSEWRIFRDDPERYFALLDRFVAEAEARGIGLIPSLFWSYFAVPDLMEEPISKWGTSESKTRAFMRRYTEAVVSRYRKSPAIWAWEFGNEYLSEADLPKPIRADRWVVPSRGTAKVRTDADQPASRDFVDAFKDFANTVRRLDPRRPIMTGETLPRPSAWNLPRGNGWKPDTREQWSQVLVEGNPGLVDTLSIHFYHPPRVKSASAYGIELLSPTEMLTLIVEQARAIGKPVWMGEFGPAGGEKDVAQRRAQVDVLLNWIEKEKIGLAAYWVFDSSNPEIAIWNAAPGNPNEFVFDKIEEFNRRLAGELK